MQLESIIESISEEIVLIDHKDLQGLANLHKLLTEIKTTVEEENANSVSEACGAIADLIESIILADVDNPDESFKVATQAVSALQQMIRDGRTIQEVAFPEELTISESTTPVKNVVKAEPQTSKPETDAVDESEQPADTSEEEDECEDELPDSVPLTGDPELLAEFVNEANEHLDNSDINLLTLETTPSDDEALNTVFRCFHTIKGVAGFVALDEIGSLAHESENLLDLARKGELQLAGDIIDVVFAAVDMLKEMVETLKNCLESGSDLPGNKGFSKLIRRIKAAAACEPCATESEPTQIKITENQRVGDILVETGVATHDDIDDALVKQKTSEPPQPRIGEILVKEGKVAAKDVGKALRAQKGEGLHGSVHVKSSVKVDTDRLDLLVDTIGELVIAGSMVCQSEELTESASPHLKKQLVLLDKITRELQEMATPLRMIPVRATFQKMARLVRDLSKKSGKEIEFVLSGEESELDKTVVDKIGDPLVHMVRNSVDHGIEANAQDRINAGKPAAGRVELKAYIKGGNFYIEIEDDGLGIDKKAILKKAVKNGLVKETDSLTDSEIFGLIFAPGLSTAKKVTDVSGRGVGMDVVKRNIAELHGHIVVTSKEGKGTKITIQLPLTLAIIDGMVVLVGEEKYIIPTLSVVRSLRPENSSITSVMGKGEILNVQGELVPLLRLNELLQMGDHLDVVNDGLIIIVEDGSVRTGLVVNDLLGQQQIVLKSLDESVRTDTAVSGGAIMPDGSVGLILDISRLVRMSNAT